MLPFFMSRSPKGSQKSVGDGILNGGGTQKVQGNSIHTQG